MADSSMKLDPPRQETKKPWHRHKVRDTCTKPAPDSNRSDRKSLNNTKRYSNKNTKNKSELWPDSEEKPTSVGTRSR
ncbi:hypothetical protein F7725_023541 [Dissostichus mawsoni]|uniref:Uncharacterized protein n=1 Tax=Dissostichus mawsoni TaxID=36200 RepID=A0A7J5XWT7_DISMA|nr:hypothetical protein F7725_023541 [Dissostichus mawsoni]